MMDFELAINATFVNFPGVEMKGYFYHLSSNLWKQRYNDEEEYAIALRMLTVLACVPPNKEEEALNRMSSLGGHPSRTEKTVCRLQPKNFTHCR